MRFSLPCGRLLVAWLGCASSLAFHATISAMPPMYPNCLDALSSSCSAGSQRYRNRLHSQGSALSSDPGATPAVSNPACNRSSAGLNLIVSSLKSDVAMNTCQWTAE